MADPIPEEADAPLCPGDENPSKAETLDRKEKRKSLKKLKRKQKRKEIALKEREEEEARLNDPEDQLRMKLEEQEEAERMERERKEFEERERLWIEAAAARKAEEDARRQLLEESQRNKEQEDELVEDDDWEYIDEGPAEIIWQGNEIIVKKKRVKVPSRSASQQKCKEDSDRPTSNPLPPQSTAFAAYKSTSSVSAQEVFASVAQQTPNFGTEQDKAHCPFHIKTGACRFGSRCSRVHFHPDKSCTLLIKNMYSGPGIAWEQDEGLEYTDEEVERCYEEFYEDVHTEFLKFGEIINFKITCEFVGVTRWKVAICGEYMKSRLKTCTRGTACNFIHCFRNPGGDYEWADWDNPPPKYWVKKMAFLFGPSDETEYERHVELDNQEQPRNSRRKRTIRYRSKRSRSGEDSQNSGGEYSDENRGRLHSLSSRRPQSRSRRRETSFRNEHEQSREKHKFDYGKYRTDHHDSRRDYYDENRDRSDRQSRALLKGRRKDMCFPDEHDRSEEEYSSDDYRLEKKYRTCDRADPNENRYRGQSIGRLSSRKEEVNGPNESDKIEKYNSSDRESYRVKDKSSDYDSGRDCPDANKDQNGCHLSRRAQLTSWRRRADLPDEHGKCEQHYDSEELEPYDAGKDRSSGHSLGREYDDGNEGRDHSHSRKKARSSSWEKESSFNDEHRISEEKYDSGDHKRYSRRYRSQDCDSSGDYSDVSKSRHRDHSSRRVHTGRRKRERDSPSRNRQFQENHKRNHGKGSSHDREHEDRNHGKGSSHDCDHDNDRYEPREVEADDVSFSSKQVYSGRKKKESKSGQKVACEGLLCDASAQACCRTTSEESGGQIKNQKESYNRHSGNHCVGGSRRKRYKDEENCGKNVIDEMGDSDTDTPKSKSRASRKRSRSRSPVQHRGKSRRRGRSHDRSQ
ncbi:zinc finger CCCH domain-containing protein 5 isoform X2 [Magnolia sinica]|uniref:zinc finger CCCH domain-containing protein 5 isoform X2 n=1 Tax=Magnolia sinica TaxID=86752 RepID=UPI00265A0140|nr:zinc finger CCCH domain-containing protein 5 isoform X2 [Magnolia sinica]